MVNSKEIIGFVEQFEPTVIAGWAIRKDDKPIEMVLSLGDVRFSLDTAWSERADVAQQHGAQFIISGYRCALPREVTFAVKDALRRGLTVEVFADGRVLQNVAKMPTAAGMLKTEPLLASVRSDELNCVIESWGHFTIDGWAVVSGQAPANYSLLGNGVALDCTVLTSKRSDVAQALGIATLDAGFEIELPGYLWEAVPEDEDARLEIRAGDRVLTPELLVLSRAKAASWVSEISRMYEGQEKQYRALLALEHVHYGKLNSFLDEEARVFLRDFAAQMNVGDFLSGDTQIEHVVAETATETASQLLLWRALRALNARLTEISVPILSDVKTVLSEHRLVGEVREGFLLAVVPLLCKSGEFAALPELLDFSRLRRLDESHDLWEMSLAPPAFMAAGDIQRTEDLLWRISRNLDRGWLNTECIRFTLEEALRLEVEGVIEPDAADKLRLSFIGLLDAFKGEWFSRLHDQELVDAMISLVAHVGNCADQTRKGVIAAAIRIYGLNPTFWSRLALCGIDPVGELISALSAWKRLSTALSDNTQPLADRLPAILTSIEYFLRHDSPEALIVLREVIANALPGLNTHLTSAGHELIENLLDLDPTEALRIAAAPLAEENRIIASFPEITIQLPETLRLGHYHACSNVFSLQEEAAKLLGDSCRHAANGDAQALTTSLVPLEEKAIVLGNWPGHFLGADLLAQAFRLAHKAGLPEQSHLLMRLGEIIRKAIAQTSANGYLPLPVQVALAHLSALPSDGLLDGFLHEMHALVRKKFGDKHDVHFQPAMKPEILPLNSLGWPSDILVIIYSCRKYLDTRVAAIRETWVQDLKARGIRYVVLVGDGDDTLQDDLLALNVSDRYEDLPKKTIKLFEWVYRHTDAQFVLKIDDDCFLDVGRYFDSLSYRKHAYYGRVLFRKEGNMDRFWHQSKSHSQLSQKAIDKSPEPSIYADGGGAYCLSRLAMQKLLEMEMTDAGKRLMACSYMEDKLVGDLLSLAGITPSDEDYESYQRRRTFSEAIPVSIWENTFFPCAVTPTKVVHLDTEKDLAWTRQNARGTALWPKKLWSTCWKPTFITNSNQLELLTDTAKLEALLQHELVAVAVIRNEMTMLPHFLAHYRMLGVKCFICVDNCSDDGSREYLHDQPDVVLWSTDTEYKRSHYGVAWQQAVLGNLCLNKWVLLADADELLIYDGCEQRSLADLVAEVEREGANAMRVDMIDMYPYGDLSNADFTRESPFEAAPWFDKNPITPWHLGSGWFSNGTGFVSHLRHRLLPNAVPSDFVSQKFALFRYQPWVRISQGAHYAANLTVSARPCWFAHFKYHAGFKDKVLTEIHRGQHFNGAAEYHRYATMLTEGKGGFGKGGISKRYENSASFADCSLNQEAVE